MEPVGRSMKQCPFCAEDILAAAIKCKHCGSNLEAPILPYDPIIGPPNATPAPPSPKSIWTRPVSGGSSFAVLLVILFGLWISGAFDSKPTDALPRSYPESTAAAQETTDTARPQHARSSITPKVTKPKSSSIYRTTATELYRDYAANEVTTDQKIGESIIEVSGVIESIDKDFLNEPEIKFSVGQEYASVAVTLEKSQLTAAGKLFRGQTVTVRCEKITRAVDLPIGSDCVLVGL